MSLSLAELERMKKTLNQAFDMATEKMDYQRTRKHTSDIDSGVPTAIAQTALALLETNRQIRELETEAKDSKPKLPRP